jgi:beta-glucanase (GH16 family)
MSREISNLSLPLSRRGFLEAAGLAVLAGITSACGHSNVPKKGRLDFIGTIDGPVNPKLWSHDLDPAVPGYNQEAQIYTPNYALVNSGKLTIDAVKTPKGYESSRIQTLGNFSFTHGLIRAVAKLPEGVGTWPALWLLPDESDYPTILAKYGIKDDPNDPLRYVWGGEIDFLETIGAQNNPTNNQPAIHTRTTRELGFEGLNPVTVPIPDAASNFHEYGLRKTPGSLEFILDGKVVHTVTKKPNDSLKQWPFDDFKYFMVANLAMGGSWGGERKAEYPPLGIDDSKGPWKFEIAELTYQPL